MTSSSAVEGIFPLTPTQHGMLVHSDGGGRAYVEQLAFELGGPIDVPAFERAWNALVRRHPALRTSFVWKRGERPLQVVHRDVRVTLERSDQSLEELMSAERNRGIDLQKAPLFRVVVSGAGHTICWTHHHMLLDGWSVPLLVRDLWMAYASERAGTPVTGEPLPPWQPAFLRWLADRPMGPALAYWRAELRETPALVPLAECFPKETSDLGISVDRVLTPDETTGLLQKGREYGVSVATMVELAVHLALRHLTGSLDTTFGLTVSGRPPELSVETSVGLYIRTIPLRLRAATDTLLRDALRGLQEKVLAHAAFDTVPLPDLRALTGLSPDETWFDGVLVFENYPVDAIAGLSTPDLQVKRALASEETNYPWMLVVAPGPPLSMRLYAGAGLGARAAERFLYRITSALRILGEAASDATMNLSLRTKEEIAAALDWNGRSEPAFLSGTVVDALLARKARDIGVWLVGPEGTVATQHDMTTNHRAEYGCVAERDGATFFDRASRIAAALVAHGVGRGDRVGIAVPRSVLQMESLLGIWLSGATYVPLGESSLPARRKQMIRRCGLRVVLSGDADTSAWGGKGPPEDEPAIEVLSIGGALSHEPISAYRAPHREDEAYVLFTSGSTGEPKGVSVSHGALWNLLASFAQDLGLSSRTRLYAVTPITFDIAALEIWGTLAFGGLLGLGNETERERPGEVVDAIAAFRANVVQTTPSLWHAWLLTDESEKKLAGLVKLVGGEPFPPELALRLHPLGGELWNVYGPTETCVWSTRIRLEQADLDTPPLGRPIANTQVWIVNALGAELGPFERGEIVIGGAGLARGYVSPANGIDAALTEQVFRGEGETRAYHTGDQGYRNDEGLLFFEGRRDGQIKLRGVRLELGEIESAILSHPSVEAAAAVVLGEGVEARLHACFVRASSAPSIDLAALENWIADRLAPGVRPVLTEIERLPVTPHGKLDRGALRAQLEGVDRASERSGDASPHEEAETLVVNIVRDVLKLPTVRATDDFFRLGGHSLLATQLTSRIRTALGVEIPLRAVFDARSPRRLAGLAMDMRRGGELDPRPPLAKSERVQKEALSFAQTRLWLVDRIAPGSAFYNIPAAVELLGPFDRDAMRSAVDQLVLRHESLRTTFHAEDGSPFARIHPHLPADVRVREAEDEAAMAALVQAFLREPFQLDAGPLLRVLMITLSPERHALFLSVHHMVADGWSMGILVRELAELYTASLRGIPHALPALPIQYADYVAWQRAWLRPDSERVRRALAYFERELRHVPPLALPTDRPRPPASRFTGTRVAFEFSREVTERIDAFAESERATTFMVLLAAFELLLARWSQETEFAVGTPIAQRIDSKLEGLVGFFANTLAIRATVERDASFEKLLATVRDRALSAYAHQDLPFERLVEELSPARDLGRAPIFQAMFVLQNAPREELAGGGLVFRTLEPETGTAKLDIECIMHRNAAGILCGILVLDADLFERETAERVVDQWLHLLGGVLQQPKAPMGSLDLRTPSERAKLERFESGPRKDYGWQGGVVKAWFDKLATLGPTLAVIGPEERGLTYEAFAAKVRAIGHALKQRGVRKGSRVGISAERSVDLVAALHGILAAGAAYVVLPIEMPEARLEQMREKASVRWILCDQAGERALGEISRARAEVVLLGEVLRDPAPHFEPEPMAPDDPIYVLYTSGSTGVPKGVEGTHGGVWNRLMWQTECFGATSRDVVLQKTPMGFDVSVWEFFWPMLLGARLEVLRDGEHRDPASIVRTLGKRDVTTVHFVPSMLRHFVEAEGISSLSALRRVVCSGEALRGSDVEGLRRLLPHVEIWNLYGPTEASVDVTFWKAPERGGCREIPIGRPVANTTCYVMDEALRPLPLGAPGELVLGGVQIALGYVGEETAPTKFLPDRLGGISGGTLGRRLYRTGDRVRWNNRGELLYEGRIDHQVKLRGQRIELGEIETVMEAHPTVQSCVCVLQGEGDRAELVAFVVQHEDAVASSQVSDWGQVFTETYRKGEGGEFDLSGWIDSLRDAPIPRVEMRVWVESTVARILALGGKRVFEVGCGTGLLAFPLVRAGRSYLGTDVASVEPLRAALSDLPHAKVLQAAAHEWPRLETPPDVIVLNSVAQYFPSAGYLTRWLEQAVRALPAGGSVFIGDVRHHGLQPLLARAIVKHHAQGDLPTREHEARAMHLMESERELLIDPSYFLEFARTNREVCEVQLLCKRGSFRNELNTFRYDVVLRVGGKSPPPPSWIVDARESKLDLEAWLSRAKNEDNGCILHILNARLSDPIWGGLHHELSGATAGLDPEDVMTRAEALGLRVRVAPSPGNPGTIDLLFGDTAQPPVESSPNGKETSVSRTNVPARTLIDPVSLRAHLARLLPEAWLPSELVAISTMPLGPSGKVDRKALSTRKSARTIEGAAPEGDTERLLARLFQDVLGLASVVRDVSFFEMGGHSLLAAKLASRLTREWGHEVPLRWIFEAPTVAALALKLGEAASTSSEEASFSASLSPETPSPLSFAQRRMYVLSALDEPSALYNIPIAVELLGPLEGERLKEAALRVVERQSALRTRLVADPLGGEPRQVLGPLEVEFVFAAEKVSNTEAFLTRPFDLFREAPVRFLLVALAPNHHHLLVVLHHMVADRWSLGLLASELSEAYRRTTQQDETPWPAPTVDVRMLAARERGMGGAYEHMLRAIETRLDGAPYVLPLPRGFVRPLVRTHKGERMLWHLPAEVVDKLRREADPHRLTPFVLVTALFSATLSRLGFGNDFLLGTPLAGRDDQEAEGLIGLFVRTVVLRCKQRASFLEHALALREEMLLATEQSAAPFELVVERLKADRDRSVEPLVQAMVVFQNTAPIDLHLPGVRTRLLPAETGTSKFDVTLFAEAARGGWDLSLEVASDLFDREAMESLARVFDELAKAASETFVCDPGAVPLRWVRALVGEASNPSPANVAEVFLQVAKRTPHAIAVEYGEKTWTYAELSLAVHEVAAGLGSRDGEIIAVSLPRGFELATAILAILVSGAAYVALDPSGPPLRRSAVLETSGASICIGEQEGMVSIKSLRLRGVAVGQSAERGLDRPASAGLASREASQKAAYVIYTSGSTGRPKGVVVSHGALANHMAWMSDAFQLQPTDRVLQRTPLTFDASVWELFAPWWVGGALVFAPDGAHADPDVLADVLRDKRISIAQFVPTVLQPVVAEGGISNLPHLRILCSGGEALTRALVDQIQAQTNAMLVNLYGPTETTIDACFVVVPDTKGALANVPIGAPIAGMKAMVTDERGFFVPDGFPGELILSGPGVADGYLGEPEETAKKFVSEFGQVRTRSYRTGDIVRVSGGKLWFLGRDDGQVKIAGVRIELEEIEGIANRCVPISAAIKRETPGGSEIVLFVEHSVSVRESAILDALRSALSAAAVPRRVVQIERLPRTPSGKLDRRALEAVELPDSVEHRSNRPSEDLSAAERILLALCKRLLPAGRVDLETNLFAAGGDSMTVLSLVSEARKAGLRVATRDVFGASNLRALASLSGVSPLRNAHSESHAPGASGPLLPTMAWFFSLGLARPDHWNLSTLLELEEAIDPARFQRALNQVADRHEALHTKFTREGMTVVAPSPVRLLLETDDGTGDRQLERLMASAHASLELTSARTLVAVLVIPCKGGDVSQGSRSSTLGLVAHHLVIDALGWPVLLGDLLQGYRGLPLTPPTSCPLFLAEWIEGIALTPDERAFWQTQGGSTPSFERASEGEVTMTERVLPRAISQVLMNDVPRQRGVSREAVLLSAIVPNLLETLQRSSVVIAMERHGRDVHDEWDFSHSLGWFTLLFPLRLDAADMGGGLESGSVNEASMAAIESRLRSIPRGGLGYGIAWARGEDVPSLPDIAFNFFGRRPDAPTGVRGKSVSSHLRDPAGKRPFALECEASIVDGELHVACVHAKNEVRAAALVESIVASLIACAGQTRGPRTEGLKESAAAAALRKLTQASKSKLDPRRLPDKGRGRP